MATPALTVSQMREAGDAFETYGTKSAAARSLDMDRSTFKHRLTAWERIKHFPDKALEEMVAVGAPPERAGLTWFKGENISVSCDMSPTDATSEEFLSDFLADIAKHSPKLTRPKYDLGEHLLVIAAADVHTGKLATAYETGDSYNIKIAEDRTRAGVQGVLDMAEHFGIEEIIINTGNDGLHVDNSRGTTTAGTHQDTDQTIHCMFNSMFWTWVWVLEQAALMAPVRVVFDASNHPWLSDWMLNRNLEAHFRNDERIMFDHNMQSPRHRKYVVYGSSLIGFTHGDGAKDADLGQLMAYEAREHWGKVQRGYWITKHLHHKSRKTVGLSPAMHEKDLVGVTVIRAGVEDLSKNVAVEVVRSPSGNDGWHDRNGYVGAMKAVEAFMFHHRSGQVARFTRPFY